MAEEMSTGEFLTILGAWLLDEPVTQSLLLILGVLQILLWVYMLVARHFDQQRLISVELRHEAIMQRVIANSSQIKTITKHPKS